MFRALDASAQAHASGTALSYLPDDDLDTPAQRWSYADFIAEVRRAANLFHRLSRPDAAGGPSDARVALLLPAIPQAYFALWGAEAAGVACPINYLLSVDHIVELLHAANCNILVALGPTPALDIPCQGRCRAGPLPCDSACAAGRHGVRT